MALVTTQVDELTRERRVLLDRLATLGLGGPLFNSPLLAGFIRERNCGQGRGGSNRMTHDGWKRWRS